MAVPGYVSGATYNPGDTASHSYVVRAYFSICYTDSSPQAGADVNESPGAPTITSITDVDACALSGVRITWGAVPNATYYDLLQGATQVSNVTSPYVYTPGDSMPRDYQVRGRNATCAGDWSNPATGTDANNAPGAPTITGITDVSACAQNGIQIAYTPGVGALNHNLYKDGLIAVIAYVSGTTYNPGDTSSHSYVVRADNGMCFTDSGAQAGADINNPANPTISGDNANTCPSETVLLTTQGAMSNYQWYIGGSPISGATASTFIAGTSGTYTVSYTNASGCSGTSGGHAVTITPCVSPPGEVSNDHWTDKQTLSWNATAGATGYKLQRGQVADLPNLLNAGNDSCTRYNGPSTSVSTLTEDPSTLGPGDFFWYLTIAYNAGGDGSAGDATAGPRVVNTSGVCP
jgi:hypothetical protein